MKGLKLALTALVVTSLAQAGILDTAKGYYAQGKAKYDQYSPQAKQYAGQASDLYNQHGEKIAPVVGQQGKGYLDKGAGLLSNWSGRGVVGPVGAAK